MNEKNKIISKGKFPSEKLDNTEDSFQIEKEMLYLKSVASLKLEIWNKTQKQPMPKYFVEDCTLNIRRIINYYSLENSFEEGANAVKIMFKKLIEKYRVTIPDLPQIKNYSEIECLSLQLYAQSWRNNSHLERRKIDLQKIRKNNAETN